MKSRGASFSAGFATGPIAPTSSTKGLLTVLMRLVFLLYAEEREMFPADDLFVRNYSIAGLFARLSRTKAATPTRWISATGPGPSSSPSSGMVHGGVEYQMTEHPSQPVKIPARHGDLFDPDRFPFLEGRRPTSRMHRAHLPRVPDGTILRVLRNLLYLKDERLSYRTLEVEQIGSVYEAIMGYRVETATGRSVAIRPEKRHGAPVTVDLDDAARHGAQQAGEAIQEAHRPQAADRPPRGGPQCPEPRPTSSRPWTG